MLTFIISVVDACIQILQLQENEDRSNPKLKVYALFVIL